MRALFLLLAASIISPVCAGTIVVPNTFQPNTPALASEVNANFQALVDALNAQQTAIQQLQNELASANATISQLQSDLDAAEANVASNASAVANIESNTVLALDGFLFLDMDAEGNDVARFDQVNVQITNGLGATNGDPISSPSNPGPVNGLGNLVIGYNETTGFGPIACSDGQFADQSACESANEIWAAEQRTGSHNLVIGVGQFYSSHGGLLAGSLNVVNRAWSSVSGGQLNTASGLYSSVSGGQGNITSGFISSVSGGVANSASGTGSSVSGGGGNSASDQNSSVSGGQDNNASGPFSTVSGGESNTASGSRSSVSGGSGSTAIGEFSSVSGGFRNSASGTNSSVSGGALANETDSIGWCAAGESGTDPCD
jgi:hypothetical protein